MGKNRDVYVDVAKGIAMLLVVRIHTEVFNVIHVPYPIIAVPFFFFLSGFYDNAEKSFGQWFPKTFKSLFLTGVIWVFISFIYVSLLHYLKDRTIAPVAFSINSPLIAGGVTWFLFALFYAKSIVWLFSRLKCPRWIIFLVFFISGAIVSRVDLPLLLDEGIAALPFYYLGKLCYPHINGDWKGGKWIVIIGMVCMLFMPFKWFPWVLVPYNSDLPLAMYPIYFMMIVLSFAPMLWLSKKLASQKWLADYGQQSLGILVIHPLILHTCSVMLKRYFTIGSFGWTTLFLLVYVATCVICYYCSLWIAGHCPILLGKPKKN